jgi:hypothetical protein
LEIQGNARITLERKFICEDMNWVQNIQARVHFHFGLKDSESFVPLSRTDNRMFRAREMD